MNPALFDIFNAQNQMTAAQRQLGGNTTTTASNRTTGGFRPTSPGPGTAPSRDFVQPATTTPTENSYTSSPFTGWDFLANPNMPASYTPPPVSADNNPFGTFTPKFENYPGFNPSQFATNDTTTELARILGGTPMQITTNAGPFNIPPQNYINFGNPSRPLNAGLLAERYSKDNPTKMPLEHLNAMTAAELNYDNMMAANPEQRGPSFIRDYMSNNVGTSSSANPNFLSTLSGGSNPGSLQAWLAILSSLFSAPSYWTNRSRYSVFG